jgi:CubicO group peptidase (beta-lactamase class C family)
VEKVTGLTFERAVASLVFEPLGLSHSFFARDDIMTRRFAVGHNRGEDGTLSVARLWRRWRGENPGGTSRPRCRTSCVGPDSISATAARKAVSVSCPPSCCIG